MDLIFCRKQHTFTGARGKQLSQGGRGWVDGGGAGLTDRGARPPQHSCLLLVLPSDLLHSHLLRDWEAVSHSDGGRHLEWIRRVAQRDARCLVVCVPSVMVAGSLVPKALSPHSGGSVRDDSGCDADGCAVAVLVARQWVHKRDSWGGWLVDAACVRDWMGSIGMRLMFVQYAARCLVFTAALVWPGADWLTVGWWPHHAHRLQSRLGKKKYFLTDWQISLGTKKSLFSNSKISQQGSLKQ